MRISINQNHRGKMPSNLSPEQIKDWWREFNGGFRNFDLPSTKQLIWAIQEGFAYTAQHTKYRKRDNFICGQHIGLDFDTGDERSSFKTLLENDFIGRNASFLHTTYSHEDTAPRTRVIFILEHPIFSKRKYSLLTEAFAETFATDSGADQSCKDPVRLFFGAAKCRVLKLNHILSLHRAAEIVHPYKEKQSQLPSATIGNDFLEGDADGVIRHLLNKVATAPDGTKWFTLVNVSRALGGYVGAGYYDEDSMRHLLLQAISPRADDLDNANNAISWGLRTGQEDPIYMEEDSDPIIRRLLA